MLLMLLLAACRPPALAVLPNPIEQRSLKTDIVSEAFGLQPLVLQDFLPLREKFLIEAGLFNKLAGRRRLLSWVSHAAREK